MSLEKLLEHPVAKPLELIANTGLNALHAANPLRDAHEFLTGAYGLVTEPKSKKEYITGLKQGKVLGKGNLAKTLLYSGLFLSGAYVPLLATRAALGGGAYLAKRALTWDPVKNAAATLVDKLKYAPAALAAGLGYQKVKQSLSKKNVAKTLDKWKDDRYFRENINPTILEAAIAAKGYAGAVGLKWLAGITAKTGTKLQTSKYKTIRSLGKKTNTIGTFVQNLCGDYLAASVFATGLDAPKPPVTETYKQAVDFAEKVREQPLETAKEAAVTLADRVQSTVSTMTAPAQHALAEAWDYIGGIDNPADKHAVIVIGYDTDDRIFRFNDASDMFYADAAKVYDDLLRMGFKAENIKVLTPDGDFHPRGNYANLARAFSDTSYNHSGSEENLKQTLEQMAQKADHNDTFTLYVAAHGLNENGTSFVGLRNGTDTMTDQELREYTKNINAGTELYVVGACHSGGFAEQLGQGRDIAVSACSSNQPAITDIYGNSLTAYFYDELARKGLGNNTTPADIKEALGNALIKFKNEHRGAFLYADEVRDQMPVMGTGGSMLPVK
ncbi:caspase family protein [Candidatus Woesearchaeota archaeon]|nr:caspase family protein [Candidatus Woesearchaeota archaeon]